MVQTDIFISYSNADKAKAKSLAEVCEARGWGVWWDRHIAPGKKFDAEIEVALDSAKCVIVLWSRASITSDWVKTEASDAANRDILLPVRIEEVKPPLEFRRIQCADLTGWGGEPDHPRLEEMLAAVASFMEAPSDPQAQSAFSPVHSEVSEPSAKGPGGPAMYIGGVTFSVNKRFGSLQFVPHPQGLRLSYTPVVDGVEDANAPGGLNLLLPLDAVGGMWATARAFLYGVPSLDENIIMQGGGSEHSDVLIKLYREKGKGEDGRLTGTETSWLRLVTGPAEEERRRILMGPRDLICLELACQAVLTLAGAAGTHRPRPYCPEPSPETETPSSPESQETTPEAPKSESDQTS
jgi:hypothetical protein